METIFGEGTGDEIMNEGKEEQGLLAKKREEKEEGDGTRAQLPLRESLKNERAKGKKCG